MATVATAVPEGPTAKAAPGMVKNSTLSLRKIVYPHACCWHMDGGRTRSVLLWYACIRKGHPQPDTISHTCLSLYVGVCVRGTFNKCNKTNDFKLYICQKNKRAALRRIRNEPEGPGRTWKDDLASVSSVSSVSLVSSCLLSPQDLAWPLQRRNPKPSRADPCAKAEKNSDQIY